MISRSSPSPDSSSGAAPSGFFASFTGRDNNFNFIRLLLASLVILGHSPELVDGDLRRELWHRVFGHGTLGGVAVAGFFMLSGFLILQSWEREPKLGSFLRKRALRIYPAFIVSGLLCALIVGPLGAQAREYYSQLNLRSLLVSMLFLRMPAVPPTFTEQHYPFVNGSMWTIEHEFRCYILVALLGLCGLTRRRWVWLGLTAVLMIAYTAHTSYVIPNFRGSRFLLTDPVALMRLAGLFLIGGCIYLFREYVRFTKLGVGISLVALLIGMYFEATAHIAVGTFGAYLLFAFAFARIPALDVFKKSSDISYGIYLYGWPFQILLIHFNPGISPWTVFVLALAGSAVCGWLSWNLIERPALRWKPRSAPSERNPAASLAS